MMAARKKGTADEAAGNFFELQRVLANHLLDFDKSVETEREHLAAILAKPLPSESQAESASKAATDKTDGLQSQASVVEQFKAMFAAGKISMRAGTLPEHATTELLHWFLDNIAHPYPDTKERQRLASKCGLEGMSHVFAVSGNNSKSNQVYGLVLAGSQVRNYYTNLRKRHWTPMREERREARCELEVVIRTVLASIQE